MEQVATNSVDPTFKDLARIVELYDGLDAVTKAPPIMDHRLEEIRWGLDRICRDLDVEEVRNSLSDDERDILDRAIEIVDELKSAICATWDSEPRG